MAELPIAQLTALMANVNRDPKKTKPFDALNFALYRPKDADSKGAISAEAAATALALRHEDRAPAILLSAWSEILAAVKEGVSAPAIRALHNDDETVWVLAPAWEGPNIRGGLICVHGRLSGTTRLRDLDHPLATYDVVLPQRPVMGWIEAGLLLAAAN
jgi:hypothetical protein